MGEAVLFPAKAARKVFHGKRRHGRTPRLPPKAHRFNCRLARGYPIEIPQTACDSARIRAAIAPFQQPSLLSSLGQVASSFGGFIITCAALYLAIAHGWWPAWLLALPAAGFLVRIFIIQHDCGHGAFFRSRLANDAQGFACSLITLAPYASWRRHHAAHHAVWNNLDKRNSGLDIYSTVLTVQEFRALPLRSRLLYRLARHPLVANVLLPPLIFIGLYRLPFDMPKTWRRERLNLLATNLALAALYGGLGYALGFGIVAAVQLTVMSLAAIIGVWFFSIQHRFETAEWSRDDHWTHVGAALKASSHLKLGRVLRWFSGNISLHHIHHLNPHIPNYRLQRAHDALSRLVELKPLGLVEALRAWRYVLWDELAGRFVTFRMFYASERAVRS